MDKSTMAPVIALHEPNAFYRVVYLNGLNDPVETLIGASNELTENDPDVLERVCHFIQGTIDFDCRQVLFMYQDLIT